MRTSSLALALTAGVLLSLAACSKESAETSGGEPVGKAARKAAAERVPLAPPADTSLDVAGAEKPNAAPETPAAPAARAPAGTVTLAVRGLHCEEACVPRLEAMLRAAPGVRSVTVDFAGGSATVSVTPDADSSAVAAAVGGGFVATVR